MAPLLRIVAGLSLITAVLADASTCFDLCLDRGVAAAPCGPIGTSTIDCICNDRTYLETSWDCMIQTCEPADLTAAQADWTAFCAIHETVSYQFSSNGLTFTGTLDASQTGGHTVATSTGSSVVTTTRSSSFSGPTTPADTTTSTQPATSSGAAVRRTGHSEVGSALIVVIGALAWANIAPQAPLMSAS